MQEHFYKHPSSIVSPTANVGKDTKIWHFCHIMEAQIGENCSFGQNTFVANGVKIGNGVKVQNNVSIYEGIICEDDVFIGPSVVFTNIKTPRSFIPRKTEYQKTVIKKGASIGANGTIICGITVGKYALIGAGAVITKNIPDFSLWVGNPAKQMGWVSKAGHRLHFNEKNIAICPEDNTTYTLDNGKVIRK